MRPGASTRRKCAQSNLYDDSDGGSRRGSGNDGSAPAALAANGPTNATFTLTSSGSLVLTTPASADFGPNAISSGTVSGSLGDVTVADGRTPDHGTWTTTVAMPTPFHIDGSGTNEVIPNSGVNYNPGTTACTNTGTGTGTFSPGTALAVGSGITAYSASELIGDTTCAWNPVITVTLPTGIVAGVYSGTILHSITGT